MHKWGAEERQLSTILHEKRAEVDAALRASIDTPAALKALEQLVRATNTYMNEVGSHDRPCPYPIGRRPQLPRATSVRWAVRGAAGRCSTRSRAIFMRRCAASASTSARMNLPWAAAPRRAAAQQRRYSWWRRSAPSGIRRETSCDLAWRSTTLAAPPLALA